MGQSKNTKHNIIGQSKYTKHHIMGKTKKPILLWAIQNTLNII